MVPDCSGRASGVARLSSPISSTLLRGSKCRRVPIPTDGPFHEGVATRNRLLLSGHRHGDRFPKHAPPSQLLRLLRMFSLYGNYTSSTTTLSNRMSTQTPKRCLLARVATVLLLGLTFLVLSLLTSQQTVAPKVAPVMVSFTSTQPASDTCYSRVTHVACRLLRSARQF